MAPKFPLIFSGIIDLFIDLILMWMFLGQIKAHDRDIFTYLTFITALTKVIFMVLTIQYWFTGILK